MMNFWQFTVTEEEGEGENNCMCGHNFKIICSNSFPVLIFIYFVSSGTERCECGSTDKPILWKRSESGRKTDCRRNAARDKRKTPEEVMSPQMGGKASPDGGGSSEGL